MGSWLASTVAVRSGSTIAEQVTTEGPA